MLSAVYFLSGREEVVCLLIHLAVNYAYSPLSPARHVHIVGYHHYGVTHFVKLSEQSQYLGAVVLIERARRLVGKQ